jgi:exopolysaccharide biosynthesis predicted pyruvyltransferase EpsI
MNILVYGWYSHKNRGDDLFIDAFHKLFPQHSFTFTDHITNDMLKDINTVFIGGGSMLSDKPNISDINKLKGFPLYYIGVGSETTIHPVHISLMRQAKLIALRSDDKLSKVLSINSNTIVIPDLVYALADNMVPNPIDKTVLVLPNIAVVPQNNDHHWKHTAWEWFRNEFSQFLDSKIDHGYKISFLSMCEDHKLHDDFASLSIISSMKHRDIDYIIQSDDVLRTISQHSIVITQRYHGIILSEIAKTPYVAIHHHDKLKKSYFNSGTFIPYYGFNKQGMIDAFDIAMKEPQKIDVPALSDIFKGLGERINSLLNRIKK